VKQNYSQSLTLNKEIKNMVNKEKKNLINRAEKSNDSKKFWNSLKQLEGRVVDNNLLINDQNGPVPSNCIPELFADFFEEKITQLTKNAKSHDSILLNEPGENLFTLKDLEESIKN